MQPIGCGLLPPGDSVKKFSAFKGLEERHRCKILVPLGLPRRILSAKGLRRFVAFSARSLRSRRARGKSHVFILNSEGEIICKIVGNILWLPPMCERLVNSHWVGLVWRFPTSQSRDVGHRQLDLLKICKLQILQWARWAE